MPGVAEVASVGGFVREYQVQVDPNRLRSFGIPLAEVVAAVRAAEPGDRRRRDRDRRARARDPRPRLIARPAELEELPLRASARGTPVRLRDVAVVSLGPEMRRGIVELDGEGEVVGGIVVMRFGENALAVIDAVKQRLDEVRPGLPAGVEIVPTYDRSQLIRDAVATLRRTLIEEMLVVSLVIFVFLLHARSALIPILTIPVGVALAFVPMLAQGLTANIMSLGGIAVAIGAMVDAAIIVVENIHKRLEAWEAAGRAGLARGRDPRGDAGGGAERVLRAARDHRVVPADLHARGHGGPALQAARVHEDLRDGLRGRALGDAHAGARGAARSAAASAASTRIP